MNTPFFLVSLIGVSARCSRNAAAVLLFSSVFSARWRTSWVLVMPAAMNPPLDCIAEIQAILHDPNCGKEAFSPHFKRIFCKANHQRCIKTGFPIRKFRNVPAERPPDRCRVAGVE